MCGFYSECDEKKSLRDFKQGNYILPCRFQKITLATVCRRILCLNVYIELPHGQKGATALVQVKEKVAWTRMVAKGLEKIDKIERCRLEVELRD